MCVYVYVECCSWICVIYKLDRLMISLGYSFICDMFN